MSALAEFAVDFPVSPVPSGAAEEVSVRSQVVEASASNGSHAVHVLLVGCEAELLNNLRRRLLMPHWALQESASGAAALQSLQQAHSDMVLVAPVLPDLDAAEFQQLVRLQFPKTQVYSLSGFLAQEPASSTDAAEVMRLSGSTPETGGVTASAAAPAQTGREEHTLEHWQGIVGSSPAMQRVFRTASLVARRATTVLIGGESGTGKDCLARAIHDASPRARQPFIVINCAAIPETLLEAELFGYTKGAFTGASQSRTGRVHAAHGGTLFLDEIGDMPLPLQSKILRFLEQGEVQRIGGSETFKVDCRILAATNVNLQQQVKERQFREDLYYRLAVMPIAVPPLRERMTDVPALCATFLQRFCPGTLLHTEALEALLQHSWPGNVRELRNVMERASLFADGRQEVLAEDIVF